jgi:hypothetical protein
MGNTSSTIQKISFEDVQFCLLNRDSYLFINTLNMAEQECLIPYTVSVEEEERIINECIKNGKKTIKIVIYGKNANDDKIYTKYQQLLNLGFYQIYVYAGGLFEWLLLQDIYGPKEFPTTKKEMDLLKYKPKKSLGTKLLEY